MTGLGTAEDNGEEVAVSEITSLLISPHRKHAMEGPCFDWLTVQGHWVRVRALLLIKPAINISITICTYFRDGQASLEKAIFPSPRKCY